MRPLVHVGDESLPVDDVLYMLLAARDLLAQSAWPRGSGRVRAHVTACLDRIGERIASLYGGSTAVELIAEAALGSCALAQKALGRTKGVAPLRSCLISLAIQLRKLSNGTPILRGLPC